MKYTCLVLIVSAPLEVVQLCLSEGNHQPFIIPTEAFERPPYVGAVVELTQAQIAMIRYQRIHTYILVNDVLEMGDLCQIKGVSISSGAPQFFKFLKSNLVSVSDLVGKKVHQLATYA